MGDGEGSAAHSSPPESLRRAVALGTSEITIKRHRAQVMHKMRVTSLAELVKIADHLGLPSPK